MKMKMIQILKKKEKKNVKLMKKTSIKFLKKQV